MTRTARLRLALLCAAAITATALGNTAVAASEPEPPARALASTPSAPGERPSREIRRDTYPFRGVIAAVDAETRRVTLEGRQARRVIHVTELTRLEKDGQPVMFVDLKVGSAVGGTLKKNAGGLEEALLIRLTTKTTPAKDGPAAAPEGKEKEG